MEENKCTRCNAAIWSNSYRVRRDLCPICDERVQKLERDVQQFLPSLDRQIDDAFENRSADPTWERIAHDLIEIKVLLQGTQERRKRAAYVKVDPYSGKRIA